MTTKRPSLRDREQQGFAAGLDVSPRPATTPRITPPTPESHEAPAPVDPSPSPRAEPTPPPGPATGPELEPGEQPRGRRKPGPKPRTDAPATVRLGGYWQPITFDAGRSAYIADLDNQPDSPDTIAGWVDRAIRKHAQLSPTRREQITSRLPEEDKQPRGVSRSFDITEVAMAAMETALVDDRRHGRLLSRNQFVAEAVRAATEEARNRNGGTLPPAPSRLPNRPPRR